MNGVGGARIVFRYILFLAGLYALCAGATWFLNGGKLSFEYPRVYGALHHGAGADVFLGDLPVAGDGALLDGDVEWRKLADVVGSEEAAAHEGVYWLRFGLPDEPFDAPVLRVRRYAHYEAYVNGDLALSYNMQKRTPRVLTEHQARLVSLPPDRDSTVVHLRVLGNGLPGLGLGLVTIADGKTEYGDLVLRNAPRALLAVALLALGLASLLGFALNVRRPMYFYFALLSLTAGASGLLHTSLAHYFMDLSGAAYYARLALPIGLFALLAFLEQLFGPGAGGLLRRTRQALLGFALLCAAAAWPSPALFKALTGDVALGVAAFCGLAAAATLARDRRGGAALAGDDQLSWILVGCAVLTLCCAANGALLLWPQAHPMLHEQAPLFNYFWKSSTLYLGVFGFVVCLGLAFAAHLRDLHQRVEHLVAVRTAELEEKHRQLEAEHARLESSTRETFEALREVSVWEERNRIAHDIHNILGHQLTGAAMQMEAVKRLVRIDPDTALEKLEAALESVRRGLGDVRSAVRMMKADVAGRAGAEELLRELIDATTAMTGVEIDAVFESLPPLDALRKKMLYAALQEGLTNGIRHGGARRFALSLAAADGFVRFALASDGAPYVPVPDGFGLSTLRERAEALGGALAIAPGDDDRGARLTVRLPVG
ncbi:sensor histidine kinase [Paenibacillus sp.]|uniref:sensor histidine kinase n=1 Tax=Paenibacillus sp. TaxID=58172 RepID=UPI002D438DDC|nr:sensor histidine kinase [Paenibacillus sp.]HZG57986.1 sensor histidine kinase [Paenibacillus sp.]